MDIEDIRADFPLLSRIEKGKKICQVVFNKIEEPEIEEVKELDETTRGEGGFGSTGLE